MRTLTTLCVLTFLATTAACGGGGGGGDSQGFSLDACSAVGGLNRRLINGTQCAASSSPVLELRIVDIFGNESFCSGSAISDTAVLTAAHCFELLSVRTFVLTPTATLRASSVSVHPNFREDNENNALFFDVAVVKTATSLGVSTYPILLGREPRVGEEGVIAGFGIDENGNSGNLKGGNMIVSDVSENHIFAAFNGSGSNTCIGDSGGPFLLVQSGQFAVAGLTSSGLREDCQSGDLSLFSNVSSSSLNSFIFSIVPDAAGI